VFIMLWQFKFTIPDIAVLVILVFLFKLFDLGAKLPKTLHGIYKLLGINNNAFTEYIVCPKCNAVVDYDAGYTIENGRKIPKRCTMVQYPNHPQSSSRQPCGAYLMRTAKSRTGKFTVRPYKVYAYQPLKQAITNLLNREGMLDYFDECDRRKESVSEGLLCDIYDGQVWKHFQTSDGSNLLGSRYNIAFTLNTDWFQPFSKTRKCWLCLRLY